MEEGLDQVEVLSKGVPVWAKTIVFIIVGSAISFTTYKSIMMEYFPEMFVTKVNEAIIHDDVEHLKGEVEADLILKFQDKMDKADSEHNQCLSKIARLNTKIESLQSQIKSYDSILEGLEKHTQFNTLMSSITNDALIEEMDKKNRECNYIYYETNQKDNWGIFDDWYNSRVLYSLELKSDCRVYYTPIFREKVKIQ